MKRNQVTTIAELTTGDRFYKLTCKAKTSMEFLGESETHNKFRVCDAVASKNGFAKSTAVKEMKGATAVVFLRNINQA